MDASMIKVPSVIVECFSQFFLIIQTIFCLLIILCNFKKPKTMEFLGGIWLNFWRILLYPTAVYVIYNSLVSGIVTYPIAFEKYTLVSIEYISTAPILIMEGISGGFNFIVLILKMVFKDNNKFLN